MTIITRKETEEGPLDDGALATARPALLAIFSTHAPQYVVFPFSESRLHIGRDELIAAGIHDEYTSKRHLEAYWNGQSFAVNDAGSTNGTFLSGHRITTRSAVNESAVVRIGRTLFLCQPQGSAKDFAVHVANGVTLGPKMQAVHRQISQLANAGESLLLLGESGSGKEIAARHFHNTGPRKNGPFIAVNCASIPRDLAERLLFGARRGTYSGAVADAEGYIQAAHGGTLFLDEIGELEPAIQAKLLRVLENREVQALGATRPQRIEFSVCAAAQRDLQQAVTEGNFRPDLFFRIGRPEVTIPPLRERQEEIPALIGTTLYDFLIAQKDANAKALKLSASFVEACLLRRWPGNVRELRTEIRSAALRAIMEKSAMLNAQHLGKRAGLNIQKASSRDVVHTERDAEKDAPTEDENAAREMQLCLEALRNSDGNVNRAAQELGVTRSKLRRLIVRHNIDISRMRPRL